MWRLVTASCLLGHILCQVETGLGVAKKINRLHLATGFCANSVGTRNFSGYQGVRVFGTDSYHYLMRMAHLFNTLARFARHLKALYAELGVRGAIAFIRQSCAAPWLEPERVRARLSQPFLLQLE